MKVVETAIPGVVLLEPVLHGDSRGYFFESFSQREFQARVCRTTFVQDNESMSRYGVVRGRVWDVAVDIRRGSPTFGRHVAVELTEENRLQLFIPRGFAHGFAVLSPEAVFQYKCDAFYAPESEGAVAWDDPALAIPWPLPADRVVLSDKDRSHPLLSQCGALFDYHTDYYA